MMRKLLTTTAFAALLATGAYAQNNTTTTAAPAATGTMAPANNAMMMKTNGDHLASNIMGEDVYNGSDSNAEKIGDVKDMVVDANGQIKQVVIGVGGFIGIGAKNVAVNFSDLKWNDANAQNANGDRWLVMNNATKDSLSKLPDFDSTAYEPAPAATGAMTQNANGTMTSGTMATNGTAMNSGAMNNGTMTASPGATQDATQTGAIDRSTLTAVPEDKMTADTLIGTTVYGANDANVGKIGDIVLTKDGKVDAVLVDVGGFLGIGSKRVAVGMDKLSFMQDANGNRYLYTTFSKDQLDKQAAYDADTYANQRDTQRMSVQ